MNVIGPGTGFGGLDDAAELLQEALRLVPDTWSYDEPFARRTALLEAGGFPVRIQGTLYGLRLTNASGFEGSAEVAVRVMRSQSKGVARISLGGVLRTYAGSWEFENGALFPLAGGGHGKHMIYAEARRRTRKGLREGSAMFVRRTAAPRSRSWVAQASC